MVQHAVMVGMGQLNSLWALGALRLGWCVTSVTRTSPTPWDISHVSSQAPVFLGTGEDALESVLHHTPPTRKRDVVLQQNQLFPSVWQGTGRVVPTVMVVWLNRKQDGAPSPGPPTQVFGAHASSVIQIHAALGLECNVLANEAQLHQALCAKYAFILTLNALGHHTAQTLGQWTAQDGALVDAMAQDALRLALALCQLPAVEESTVLLLKEALQGHQALPARGRTSSQRVERATAWAVQHHVPMPAFEKLKVRA